MKPTRDFLPGLLLLYPSVPYLSFGWGSNVPFFIAALLYLLPLPGSARTRRWDHLLILPILSLPVICLATMIMRWRIGSMDFTVPMLGFRDLVMNIAILFALGKVMQTHSAEFIFRGLMRGLLINLGYGVVEIIDPTLVFSDEILHEHNRYAAYLLREETARIRLLWSEPAQAGIYLLASLPLIFLTRSRMRYLILAVWTVIFIKVAAKGAVFFLFFALLLFCLFRPRRAFSLLLSNGLLIAAGTTLAVLAAYVLESEFLDTIYYIQDTIRFTFSMRMQTFDFSTLYDILQKSDISESQYIRFINLSLAIQNLFAEPYALITGFSPFGMKYYLYLHPETVPEGFSLISGLGTRYSAADVHLARHLVQSAFFEAYVSYGLPMFIFMIACVRRAHRAAREAFPAQEGWAFFHLSWVTLCNVFMTFPHGYIIIYTYALLALKLASDRAGGGALPNRDIFSTKLRQPGA